MTAMMGDGIRRAWAKALLALFVAATMMVMAAGGADAAPNRKCRNNPEHFSHFHGKCLSDKRIERLTHHGR